MAKIKLGNRPKNFKAVIKVPLPEGVEGTVEVTFKYRTRKEFAAFMDDLLDKAKALQEKQAAEETTASLFDIVERSAQQNADLIMDVAEDWNLDVEFSRESVELLCDELPGVANAIINFYRVATTEGRLGN